MTEDQLVGAVLSDPEVFLYNPLYGWLPVEEQKASVVDPGALMVMTALLWPRTAEFLLHHSGSCETGYIAVFAHQMSTECTWSNEHLEMRYKLRCS